MISFTRSAHLLTAGLLGLAISSMTSAAPIVIDFETEDDFVTPLVNGQDLSSPPEFGQLFNLVRITGPNWGPAIFDSSPSGPNSGINAIDPDLLVDKGNILILQNNVRRTQTVPGIFDVPDDDADGGAFAFQFINPIELLSVDLVDINGNGQSVTMVLTDTSGLTRSYFVPSRWTRDIFVSGPKGWDRLSFTTLAPQAGETGLLATASEIPGFNPSSVARLDVTFEGSAGLDNLTFLPEPTTLTLLCVGGLLLRRRRRTA